MEYPASGLLGLVPRGVELGRALLKPHLVGGIVDFPSAAGGLLHEISSLTIDERLNMAICFLIGLRLLHYGYQVIIVEFPIG